MKAVRKMLRTLLGMKRENCVGDAQTQRREDVITELATRQHAVARRVHVLEWEVLRDAERGQESQE